MFNKASNKETFFMLLQPWRVPTNKKHMRTMIRHMANRESHDRQEQGTRHKTHNVT